MISKRIIYRCPNCSTVLATQQILITNHALGTPVLYCRSCDQKVYTGKKLWRDMTKRQRIFFFIAYTLNWSLVTFIASSLLIYLIGILFNLEFKELGQLLNLMILAGVTIVLSITITLIQRNDILERAKTIEKDYDNRSYWIIDFFTLN